MLGLNYIKMCFVILLLLILHCDYPEPFEPEKGDTSMLGLLTDEELHIESDANEPEENPVWSDWIKKNHIPIRSLSSGNYYDLNELGPYLENKRIVQLGANGHGVAQFHYLRVRLVKFLHKVLGFNVIAFESSILDCFLANPESHSHSPYQMMVHSINGVWWTEEVLPLFEYIQNTRDTDNPLILAGFDIYSSSHSGIRLRPDFFYNILSPVDSNYAENIRKCDSLYVEKAFLLKTSCQQYQSENASMLDSFYVGILDFINKHEQVIQYHHSNNPQIVPFVKQVLISIQYEIQVSDHIVNNEILESIYLRDQRMANNLSFLLDEMYPDKKVITWAHNGHVYHDRASTTGGFRNMGTYIHNKYGNQLYTICTFMYKGQILSPSDMSSVYNVLPAVSESIESILYRAKVKFCFVDLSNRTEHNGNSWMFNRIQAVQSGGWRFNLVPRDQFDGALFVYNVSPPHTFYKKSPSEVSFTLPFHDRR